MAKKFCYNGQWFTPYRKMTRAEREQPLSMVHDRLSKYCNAEFEAYWDLMDFYKVGETDADLFWWNGKIVIPNWDSFYILNGWL